MFWRCPFRNPMRSLLIVTEVLREFWVSLAKCGHDRLFPDALQVIATRQPPNIFLSYLHLFIPTHCRLLLHLITHNDTHTHIHTNGRTPLDEGTACLREHYLTIHKSHAPGGIRSLIPSSRAAPDPRLRSPCYQDQPKSESLSLKETILI